MGDLTNLVKDAFLGSKARLSDADVEKQYRREISLVDHLPWFEYLDDSKHFLLSDGVSRMAAFEIKPLPSEGRSQGHLDEALNGIAQILSSTMPEQNLDPWVMQIHYSTESDYGPYMDKLRAHVRPEARGTKYTEHYLERMNKHMGEVHRAGGYFHDEVVTDAPWAAKVVKVRILVYRRYFRTKPKEDTSIELDDVVSKLESNLQGAGIKYKQLNGSMFYEWMRGWMNPAPSQYEGGVAEMLREEPWPEDSDDAPFGRDMAEMMFGSMPRSDEETGFWYLDEQPHCAISLGQLRRPPLAGQLTGELDRGSGGSIYALTDRLPEGTRMVMSVTSIPQDEVTNKITTIDERAMGDTAGSRSARKQARDVLDEQLAGDPLFPVEITVYVKGKNERELRKRINSTVSLVGQQGVVVYDPSQDPISLDTFVKNLPAVYIPEKDRGPRARARLYFASHAAALSPIWGRSTGTGNPGITMWNRAAEPLTVDPLHKSDRMQNAHSLIVGPSGSGKSATLVSMLDQMMAIHRPRVFIIEAGNSFGLWAAHAKRLGLTVNETALSMNSKVSIPPFSELYKIAEERDEVRISAEDDGEALRDDIEAFSDDDDSDLKRDRLGEAEQIVRVMITGGDPEEDKHLRRADRTRIREAIVRCAQEASDRPVGVSKNVKPSEIASMLGTMSLEPEYSSSRTQLQQMGDAMALFSSGLNGHLFESEGETWPEVDVTIVDMAQAVGENSEDTLAVAYMSLLQQINAIAERDQHEDRMTIVLTDEGHIILKNPLLAPFIMRVVKMWRKLGAWYWVATQNLTDFKGPARALLNTMEFWWLLQMTRDEVEQTTAFVDLTDAQKTAMLQCRKAPGKYTEGVVMSGLLDTVLFRNVAIPEILALAQTEKDEKSARRQLMLKHGLSTELDAAYMLAEQMITARRKELEGAA